MAIYWGDIHNHCGISYGYGSLKNALNTAKNHLDFVAVTGHAMWPDMYERKEETAFVVDFHREGFKKLKEHWDETEKLVADANKDGLVTFQAYEMHSCEYGDHHIVSPDDSLPLIYRNSPAELVSDVGVRALTVAHHIGYTPNYRGIDWNKYDENITPLIEVCSKHGCSMNETAPFAYYHNMGPRDSHNTVKEGLKRGYHFGFVGSTDHHCGFPGSYGDGKLAVIADEKSRESIWDALINRRTYAVTGDRILCDFKVDGNEIGSIVPVTEKPVNIKYSVKACYNIDKVVIYKNYKPVKIVEGLMLEPKETDSSYKFRIEMGWGNNKDDLFEWKGKVSVSDGKILDAEPCFRGRSVLAPSTVTTDGYDDANKIDDKITELTENTVEWQCYTVKNVSPMHPLTSAVVIELKGNPDTKITIDINGHNRICTVKELMEYGYSEHTKYFHSQAFKVHPIITESQYTVSGEWADTVAPKSKDFYHMEVFELNGSCAFVTPVYFK